MFILKGFVGLAAVTGTLGFNTHARLSVDNGTDTVVPNHYIVEASLGADLDGLISELSSHRETRVLKVFRSDVFLGVAVESTNENFDTLQQKSAVSRAWNSNKIKLDIINAQTFNDDIAASVYSVHNMTGVDRLHEAGIKGNGAIVAVVDTGINWAHSDLGGGFGPGFKVSGGYDLVGDVPWPWEQDEKVPDDDPTDTNGHGTHVAGIVAAQGDQLVGVAPESTLLAYKVFGTVDETDDTTLIEAFLMAYEAGADIITCSVGGLGGFSNNAWAEVASRLVEQGVVVVIAAGNNGYDGPFFASNGAAGKYVLGVASVEPSELVAPPFLATFNLDGQSNTTTLAYMLGWDEAFPRNMTDWPIVPLSFDTTVPDFACQPLPDDTGDLSQVIPLVRRGDCGYETQQSNLEAFGARYIMFYNTHERTEEPWSFYQDNSILSLIEAEAGEAIINTVKAGGNVTADFSIDPNTNYYGIHNSAGGRPSIFTSWGGLYDLTLKPDLAAPGGSIFSTYLRNNYAVMSGTSMACPYVAGVAALYVGQFGGRKVHGAGWAKDLSMRLMASGKAVPWSDGYTVDDYGSLASLLQVGTGLVDALKVLDYTTSLSWAKFNLNDTHFFSRYHEVDITNNGDEPVSYRFSIQDAGGFEAWAPYSETLFNTPRLKMNRPEELTPVEMVPDVSFPQGSFIVQPGQTRKAKFSFRYPNYPQGLDNLSVYSGKVIITSSKGEHLGVPYFGIASNLKDTLRKENFRSIYPVVESGWSYPFPNMTEKSSWTLNLTIYSQDYPKLYSRHNWATQELRWDIFEKGWTERKWTYPPVVGENGYVGSVAYWFNSPYYYYFDPETDDANYTVSFPLTDVPRVSLNSPTEEYWWMGMMANGSKIVPGDYVMRFGILGPFGVQRHADNWDTYIHPFTILPLE
ncbi:hypothetical protein S7711_05810 [Stachybotrys chartarum IBT 7711]|uniref:Peptidase S8/S53 domain-containing protein n=1 Tax=Stachybotrys chartarum (strain CBS 109288 / IBT 7711) TaxID=1280523 RepID=A0A084AM48_STACB|nr:hypothetical protein S7711_05810 [Stachybotrys chartarum IBT 7711]